MPVTVLDANGEGRDSDVIAGVIWAADHGADVILMAFSNPGFSQNLQDAIDYAWSRGAVLVAAVGNDGVGTPTFPAGDRGVIGVSGTDQADALLGYSNYGKAAFLAAPGENIATTDLNGDYVAISGTSSSAAIVAGVAAFLKAVDPTLTNGIIVGRLARTADPAGTQEQTGNGRVNLARALADTGTDSIQPAGADPVGDGGPFVGPYVAAATSLTLTPSTGISGISVIVNSGGGAFDNNAVNIGIYWDGTLNTTSGTQVTTCNSNNGGNIQGTCTFAVPGVASVATYTVVASQISSPSGHSVSATFTVTGATKLAVTSVNGGTNPTFGTAFSVVVQSQNTAGTPTNVVANTSVTPSVKTGTGTLGGTVTGTITAGTNSVTISGVTYSKAENGVVLTATRTSGDTLTAGDSAPFNVQKAAQATLTLNAGTPLTYNTSETLTTSGGSGTGVVTFSVTSAGRARSSGTS